MHKQIDTDRKTYEMNEIIKKNGSKSLSVFSIPLILKPTVSNTT
jgi:hypothetical protein